MNIRGFLELERSILCCADLLGKTIDTAVGNIDARIFFPVLPAIDDEDPDIGIMKPLLAPTPFSDWENDKWGYPVSYPTVVAIVSAIGLQYQSRKMTESDVQEAYKTASKWMSKFVEMCFLLKPGINHRDENFREKDEHISFYDGSSYIQNNQPTHLYAYMHSPNNALSLEDVLFATEYASGDRNLHTEYKMLLSAYESRRQCDNRKVVLEACSAVELCLVKRIKRYCDEKNIEESILTDKYRTLGERFKLIGKIDDGFDVPFYRDKIVPLRNSVFHSQRIDPSDKDTDEMIDRVERCLAFFHIDYF